MRESIAIRCIHYAMLAAAMLGLSSLIPVRAGSNQFNVINNGFSAYTIDGADNPTLTLNRGESYSFFVNASGHPFWIKTLQSTGSANAFNDGVANNGRSVGLVSFNVPVDAPDQLFYNCGNHLGMSGPINIVGDILVFRDGFES